MIYIQTRSILSKNLSEQIYSWLILAAFSLWQIHLHDQEEVPPMKDRGFAVAPGTQNLVAVEMSTVYANLYVSKIYAFNFCSCLLIKNIASTVYVCLAASLWIAWLHNVFETVVWTHNKSHWSAVICISMHRLRLGWRVNNMICGTSTNACNFSVCTQIKSLAAPHGNCDDQTEVSVSECQMRCKAEATVELCHCHDVYLKPEYNVTCKRVYRCHPR